MPDFDDFPPEIPLQIFPHMHLKGLISARGVSKRWRELISLADIHPARIGLLELYQRTIHDPRFLDTRPWTLENLRPFDRQAYIDALLAQHSYIPDDFRFYVLEWPARAAIACAWPGLPDDYITEHGTPKKEGGDGRADDVDRIAGCNFLGRIPPLVHRVTLDLSKLCLPQDSSDGESAMEEIRRESRRILLNASDDPSALLDEGEDSDPEEYYRTRDKFDYSPPPYHTPVLVTFPALLVWERDDARQVWLALTPDTPFSVYILPSGIYYGGESRQFASWTSWLAAQLRFIHRRLRAREAPSEEPKPQLSPHILNARGEVVLEDVHFRSIEREEEAWTADDEALSLAS
ncbi:hypothetical protein C8R46DRAFT_611467 [Mycena filopes]|nr:hypothetical protein C8R46DRAFT_1361752 [Mycena filopes]KAJ7137636.1 hypothetical protein C8R46DRAFT_611467 [Mycena filopes]